MYRVFVRRLGRRPSFWKLRHHKRLMPPAVIPRARVGYFSVTLLPGLGFLTAADQRERRSGHNRNVGAADDLQQAQRMRHFLIAPLISAYHRDAKHLYLRRLNQYQQGLHIAAARPRTILVDYDFATGRSGSEGMPDESAQQKDQCEFPGVPIHQSSSLRESF